MLQVAQVVQMFMNETDSYEILAPIGLLCRLIMNTRPTCLKFQSTAQVSVDLVQTITTRHEGQGDTGHELGRERERGRPANACRNETCKFIFTHLIMSDSQLEPLFYL
jgi:hypothetical protein